MSGVSFVHSLLDVSLSNKGFILNRICSTFYRLYGFEISTEGFNKRFTSTSEQFVFSILAKLLSEYKSNAYVSYQPLSWCQHIHVIDTTGMKLPASMAKDYLGQGASVPASLKIYLETNHSTGELVSQHITAGSSSGNALMDKHTTFQSNCLYLFDLGFFKKERFVELHEQEALFVSRLRKKMCCMNLLQEYECAY